jgi:aldehyde:ferredoxin oxidoreductase
MAGCYNHRILHVDLTTPKVWVEEPPESFYRTYGGGSAMGMYYILKETPQGVDALAPDNVLTLFTGVATGLPISGQSRLSANARSPLVDGIGDSQSGGFFPAEMKFAGFDGVTVRGRSPRPVYLWLHDGQWEIRDAAHLWGKTTDQAEDLIKAELGDQKIEVLQIGPAGEKLVRFASLINMCNRANGRTGMGAVMGAKNLKAIAVRGRIRMVAADAGKLGSLQKSGTKNIEDNPDMHGLYLNGTADGVPFQNVTGTLPTRNFNEGQFEGYEQISGETMTDTILTGRDTCFACTVRCKRVVETTFKDVPVLPRFGGPEYETVSTLGSYCGVADLNAISLANQICNQYGMDTISCGATIAFGMECFEKGLLTSSDTGGIDLKYGNASAMVQMVELIARRQGFGDVLAEGSRRAARQIGGDAADYLITVKGSETPAHMPQAKRSLGLIYAVNPFGADHQSSEHDPNYEEGANPMVLDRLRQLGLTDPQPHYSMSDEKIRFAYLTQLLYSATDAYNVCQFVWGPAWELYDGEDMVTMLRAATGWDVSLAEVMQVGERRLNMMRAYNAREGIDRKADQLPKKFFKPLQGTGPTAGVAFSPEEIEGYKDVYYRMAGWDVHSGVPTREKLDALGLGWIELSR